jgi:GTPase
MLNEPHCGYVAIIGRPNVGKSTLLNRILGQKLSITSHKPQTTRHQIFGIKTKDNIQTVYVDTPGIHEHAKRIMNRFMNRAAITMIYDVNVIVFIVDARVWNNDDELILKKLKQAKCPVILALNKVDLIKDKDALLPKIAELNEKYSFAAVIPLSATKDVNVAELEKIISKYLPKGAHFFPDNKLTDKDDRFLITEVIREKIMRLTNKEVPYSVAVIVESFKKEKDLLRIGIVIWVERKGQRIIIIGEKGKKLKEIGRQARLELEKMFGTKVFLTLWVKIKEGWVDDKESLGKLGIG